MEGATGQLALADYYRAVNRPNDALQVLAQAESDRRGFAPAKVRRARILYAAGRRTEAAAALDAALERDPANTDGLVLRAQVLRAERNLESALKQAEAAVSSNSSSVPANLVLGRVQRDRGFADEAIKAFNQVLRLSPSHVEARLGLAELHLAAGRTAEALRLAGAVLAEQPSSAPAILIQARALAASGKGDEAERMMTDLVRVRPTDAVAHATLGNLQRQRGNVRAAHNSYTRALSLESGNLDALAGLAALDIRAGRGADAAARIEKAAATSTSGPLILLAARTYAAVGDLPASERYVRRLIETEPANTEAYGLLARIRRAQGRVDEAIAELDRMAPKSPSPAAVHTAVGELLQEQKRIDEAKKRYELALSIEPGRAAAANNLAWLIAEHGGNLDNALQLAQTARARMPDSADVADTLGWIYYKKQMYPQAVTTLKESVERAPAVPTFKYHLGLAYAKNGEARLARTTLEAALEADPSSTLAAEARQTLTQLGAIGG
jgi:tetratricopeptide (TPR) repeat protein